MPQMSPMWWLTLMLMFNSMVMMTISMVYFNYYTSLKSTMIMKKLNLIWKW
uniref:ATP synthase F0 subunit 8 n=1 Tax=Pantaleon erectonodatus TaxID=3065215 RepID=A0AA95NLN6_9HEMI|nr:ATP synthase F0 subunit 8 [Pantaleon erectonodatus]WKZ08100.1 ATP synthase F0 subunit 8 [Pantaleon erectonodatus]